MAPVQTSLVPTATDLDVIHNRVAVALAKRERLLKAWTASSARPRLPPRTHEELDAEDARLFSPTSAGLGLGAPIPKEFLDGDTKRKDISTNDKLRHLILGNRAGLQASKSREKKDGVVGAKRALEGESSDDDQGRSALGKAKKPKNGNAQEKTNVLPKGGVTVEAKQDTKSPSQENLIQKSDHVFHSKVNPQVKPDKRTDTSREKSVLQNAKIRAACKQKPLVDYTSDEESDYRSIEPIAALSQKKQSSKLNISAVPTSLTSARVPVDVKQNSGHSTRSDACGKRQFTTPSIADIVTGNENVTQSDKDTPQDGVVHSKEPSSKPSSNYSSKSLTSSTDSEPSDMETVIPLSLTSDVVGRTSLPASIGSISATEAKKAKKRDRRARKKKERDQQRKELPLGITSGGAEKSVIDSTGGEKKSVLHSVTVAEKLVNTLADGAGVAKKIKDRLLDADGN